MEGIQMDRKRERTGRMQCFMKKEDKSLIDVDNFETTGERCCHQSWRTPLNSSLCTFIGMKHISPTYSIACKCIWGWQHLQKLSPKCHFSYILLLFLFCFGVPPMTLLTGGALTDPQLPATASNMCTTDPWLSGDGRVSPKQKSWLRRWC